jgi:hypothetical protein
VEIELFNTEADVPAGVYRAVIWWDSHALLLPVLRRGLWRKFMAELTRSASATLAGASAVTCTDGEPAVAVPDPTLQRGA